jgi:peptidoglycan/LPS O-acetylase OafA/YrhL
MMQDKWNYGIQHARGIAVLCVVAFHFFELSSFWGRFGVNLFFCISGYLMIQILTKPSPGGINLKNFLKKRFVRLYPALFFTVLLIWILCLLDLVPGDATQYLVTGLGYLFFVGNFSGVLIPGSGTSAVALGHMWTLALEWQMYILLALFMKVIYGSRIYRAISITFFSLACTFSLLTIFFVDVNAPSIILNSLMCSICFLLGTITFLVNKSTKTQFFIGKILLFIIFVICSGYAAKGNAQQLLESLQVISFSTLVFLVCKDLRKRHISPLDFFGRISYSYYLLHYPVYFLMHHYFQTPNLLIKIASVFLATCLAYFSWLKVESHFWMPSRQIST